MYYHKSRCSWRGTACNCKRKGGQIRLRKAEDQTGAAVLRNAAAPVIIFYQIFPPASPDRDAVFGSKIHIVSFGDAVEIQEFIKLLQICVNAQIVQRMNIRQERIHQLGFILAGITVGVRPEERVIIEILFPGRNAEKTF